MISMNKRMKKLISLYPSIVSKIYIRLKYLLTPFEDIDSAVPLKANILDIGCGNGQYSIFLGLKSKVRKVSGIDNDKKRIRLACSITKRNSNISFSYTDLNKEYNLKRYDTYLINDVLHHIPDKSKIKLLEKIYNNMRNDNLLIIKDMHKENKIKYVLNYINDKIMTKNQKLYFLSTKELTEILENIGFKVKVKKIRGYPFPHIMCFCRR